jgi:hypothetical protein
MRIIAIDASPINGGPASYAVDVAASSAEAAGAEVIRVRLYDLHGFCCTECGACAGTGRCTKRDGLLSHACRVLHEADALVVGAPARLSTSSQGALSLLRRLLGGFAGVSTARGASGRNTFAEEKRAAVIASCATPFGVPLGPLGMARAARKLLGDAGVTLVDCAPVPLRFTEAAARDITRERAEDIGRRLASPATAAGGPPRSRGRRSRVAPILLTDTGR